MLDFNKYKNKMEYPEKPKKPKRPKEETSQNMLEYSKELHIWETNIEAQSILLKKHREEDGRLMDLFKQDCLDDYGLLSAPKKIQDEIYYLAWEDGRSAGLNEVYLHMDKYAGLYKVIKEELKQESSNQGK